MLYNIVVLADLHWGATNPEILYNNLELLFLFLKEMYDIDMPIDMVVIDGDYFDFKLLLNSQASILAVQWMDRLIDECKKYGVKRLRIIKGTQEHDNDQLEIFREKETDYFKIFNENTVEEPLPDLKCIYCPDENINAKDYKLKYQDHILEYPNIGFFHGSFDIVLPDIVVQLSEESSLKSIIYEYSYWSKFIKGPMVAGHWHSGVQEKDLIYIGSYERWEFNEPENKGFGFIQFNTYTNEYFYQKIVNPYTTEYQTFEINTSLYNELKEYDYFISQVNKYKKEHESAYVRIKINIDDNKESNNTFITSLRHYYINDKRVKIILTDKLKKEKASLEKKHHIETKTKYGFVLDKSLTEAQKIQEFILASKDKEMSIDVIESFIKRYLDK